MTGPNPVTPIPVSHALTDLMSVIADAKANPPTNPYPHRVVHANMAYTWYCHSEAAKYELPGHVKQWLAGACRERGIAASKMTRAQMIVALVAWQTDAEAKSGWAPTPTGDDAS